MDIENFIKTTYSLIEGRLDQKLGLEGFYKTDYKFHYETFGSRYSIWKNFDLKIALRLIWDGKDMLFCIEESPFSPSSDPMSWADIVVVPIDFGKASPEYQRQTIDYLIDAIE